MTQPNDPTGVISAEILDRCGEVNFSPFGLTKREYFAAMALMGKATTFGRGMDINDMAERAVSLADALIEALNN